MPLMIMQCFKDQKFMLILLKYHIWLIWPPGAPGHMAMNLVVHRAFEGHIKCQLRHPEPNPRCLRGLGVPEGRARYRGRLFGPIQGHLGLFYTIYGYLDFISERR